MSGRAAISTATIRAAFEDPGKARVERVTISGQVYHPVRLADGSVASRALLTKWADQDARVPQPRRGNSFEWNRSRRDDAISSTRESRRMSDHQMRACRGHTTFSVPENPTS